MIARISKDFRQFNDKVQVDKEGNKLNNLNSTDPKTIRDKLNQLSNNARTNGEYFKIVELYGFKILVKTEESQKEGAAFKDNHFFIEGEGQQAQSPEPQTSNTQSSNVTEFSGIRSEPMSIKEIVEANRDRIFITKPDVDNKQADPKSLNEQKKVMSGLNCENTLKLHEQHPKDMRITRLPNSCYTPDQNR